MCLAIEPVLEEQAIVLEQVPPIIVLGQQEPFELVLPVRRQPVFVFLFPQGWAVVLVPALEAVAEVVAEVVVLPWQAAVRVVAPQLELGLRLV